MSDCLPPIEPVANEIVDSAFDDAPFELSAGTIAGRNKRFCPCCKKEFKVERLGEHIKKSHPEYWTQAFTVEALEHAIAENRLVGVKVAYEDHDQDFLICLACNSIRTTDRNHFQKNGQRHLDQHKEECKKMLASKTGQKYTTKDEDVMTRVLKQLDKLKRDEAYCRKYHSDETMDKLTDAEREIQILKDKMIDLESERNSLQRCYKEQKETGRVLYQCLKVISDDLLNVYNRKQESLDRTSKLIGECMGYLLR